MNRPFPAFAALLALLALAMFAVSSSSRSTTVRPAPAPPKATAKKPPLGGSNFVIVVPAGPDAAVEITEEQQSPLTTVVCIEAPSFDFSFERDCRPSLAPVKIQAAEETPCIERRLPEVDCRSHYDPYYDQVVYGATPQSNDLAGSAAAPGHQRSLSAGELLQIFDEFGGGSTAAIGTTAGVWPSAAEWGVTGAASTVAAAKAWVHYYLSTWLSRWAGMLGLADNTSAHPAIVEWSEYAELMDQRFFGEGSTSDPVPFVRFGGSLWRSAASTSDQSSPAR